MFQINLLPAFSVTKMQASGSSKCSWSLNAVLWHHCLCVCETKALQPGVQQEWGTKQTTQNKVQSNQPTWHPYDRVPAQAQVPQLKSGLCAGL